MGKLLDTNACLKREMIMSSIIDYYADVVAYSEDDSFDDFIEEKVGEMI